MQKSSYGAGSHDPGPHLSARMCDVSLLFSPQPTNPHQFRYTSCTCNKNTPIHNYSADHLLIHVQPTCAPHLGPYGRGFLSALLPVAYFSFTPWSPLECFLHLPTQSHLPPSSLFLSRNASTPTSHNIKFGF